VTNIVVKVEDAVGTLTISRRERFNSLDVETARDLRKAGLQLARDEKVRAVVLRGEGGVFCSGADLKFIRAGGSEEDLGYLTNAVQASSPVHDGLPTGADACPPGYGESFKEVLEYIHSTISEIRRSAKPWIAAVDGMAAAGGFGLAMSCDLVLASERSTFEWAYGKTGLTGAESSTFFLPRLVGFRRAMQLVLLNPRLSAHAALEWGLINDVIPNADFRIRVQQIATRLAQGPTEALGIAKQLINQAAGVDRLDFHLDRELENLAAIANGGNFAEGIEAFFEKRPARFAVK
jgi:2-(1,2-epoxy-1,2-dihydrophenyl)acetyl-CoA isomerase